MKPDYSFQERVLTVVDEARRRGVKRLCIASPTGSGKGNMIKDLAELEVEHGRRPVVYSNRKVIRHQLSQRLADFGIQHGIRASGYQPDLTAAAQVSSVQTERARSLSNLHPWELHEATMGIVDEAHAEKAKTAKELFKRHTEQGAMMVGFTATPCGIAHLYDQLEVLVQPSELRRRGVIVPIHVFAGSELDMEGIDINDGEYVQKQAQRRFDDVRHVVLGDVFDWFDKLNPDRKPSVLFAPGVPESRWFADKFTDRGIPAFHIDADTKDDDRLEAFEKHRTGEIKILSSYGVLAMGWDAPWTVHGILVRPVAAVSTYLQLVGRIARAFPGKEYAILQDHVGAWHKPGLGSPNADRNWELDDTDASIRKREKQDRVEANPKEKKEPAACPKCGQILAIKVQDGFTCVCGHVFKQYRRQVIMADGTLARKVGPTVKARKPRDDSYFWASAVFAGSKINHNMKQTYWLANKLKQEHTKDPDAEISLENVNYWTPPEGSGKWNAKTAFIYPWAVQRKR